MTSVKKAGYPVVGVVFLALAVLQFLQGDDWVVWFLFGIIFGGLTVFQKKQGEGE